MIPQIEMIGERKLVGIRIAMSFSNNRTAQLWRTFMPRKREIKHVSSLDLVSMQLYPSGFDFDTNTYFEKWAAIEVTEHSNVPVEMEISTIPSGLYAIFHYQGLSTDTSIFQYIFMEWLPASGYVLDDRPHFELLGAKYKNNDPNSQEDIFIPIKKI